MNRYTRTLVAGAAAVMASLASPALAQDETVVHVPDFADFLAVDGDSVWATNRGRVEKWSREGKQAQVPLGRPCGTMSIAAGSLWVADCGAGTINRIDLASGKLVAAIYTGIANQAGELNVAFGAGSIWVASNPNGQVARIDPATNAVTAQITVDPGTWYLAYGFDAVWAVSAEKQTLQRIDPATNNVTGSTPLGTTPGFLAAGEGAVWVQEQGDGTLARIDPASVEVTGRIKVGDNLKWGDIDTGAGKVWLRTTDDQRFVVIDAATSEITARMGKAAGSGALRYTPEGVWTSAHDEHIITWWPTAMLPD
ncbi:YncE family protein [Novosphingobium mangrovi (ex Hu et al. 2023)]|uniref:YncE family protein n=1 Tax=Novosphingobium mangrovi (ex Hu et al. 2023) TaxID=2930094 RepID=A0ABT0AEE9_9SPHN|nr:YncE family protein [Novosphingobium mangrovi (ex Hu et al. 2023)]MCJ1961577.1 YncE family protein [Novosphingobium mangrovi (ex Hu et al. 2023)]